MRETSGRESLGMIGILTSVVGRSSKIASARGMLGRSCYRVISALVIGALLAITFAIGISVWSDLKNGEPSHRNVGPLHEDGTLYGFWWKKFGCQGWRIERGTSYSWNGE